ncbi:hypothetical protein BJP34_35445 [Moorena producens PAL-8-15-08-1]|uniref:Uncharacterized protein n=1 Tax=Moorena producens PAL-8-15-08-1 TaxID=1458985 RepID=A0A1D8U297_9CYAN|nr:hypothetical protein BJP34_35445 [Moorena producens PAL-8-15-08-1]
MLPILWNVLCVVITRPINRSKQALDINGITVEFAERLPVPLILFTIAPQIEPGKISTLLKAHAARL